MREWLYSHRGTKRGPATLFRVLHQDLIEDPKRNSYGIQGDVDPTTDELIDRQLTAVFVRLRPETPAVYNVILFSGLTNIYLKFRY
ncbi:hypothetical protein PsAD13_02624 [Pseudovibrio sp. Ad13]|nr:hypothetical protein PsAD13_02624 [Pseudovibrio sp. Ad13]KZL25083.1 hypothetical protein PsAD37_02436 [Pseudovibrio sp. Ad37]